jgi:N,N'-diacetyllegionaminate synthase
MTAPRVFIIAEAGVNHNGSVDLALKLCDAAHTAGADAVKFQTFVADDLVVPGAPTAEYQTRETGHTDQYTMLKSLELTQEQHQTILQHCQRIGIEFFSTPFSVSALDMLVQLGVRRVKLSSGELTHRALVEHAAQTALPLIISTGMATMDEIREALSWVTQARGNLHYVTVLHCTSAYPASADALNLRAIQSMARDLNVPIGYSDHSLGIEASVAAVALGAMVIEKHLTLDKKMPGPDHSASLEPAEFAQLVAGIRTMTAMLGNGIKAPSPEELNTAQVARRSVVAAQDLAAGQVLTADLLMCRRPATGIAPRDLPSLMGRRLKTSLRAGDVLQWSHLQ